jgi:hypothetical protein
VSAPDELAQPQADETAAGALPAIIHLPDLSQPEPTPPTPRPAGRHTGRMKGRHFGPRPVADPRSARLQIRCTPATQQKALAAAQAENLSVSAYVCALIDGTPGPRAHRAKPDRDRVLLAQMLAALGRSGSNLNQLLKRVNAYDFRGQPELLEMQPAMKAAHSAHHELVAAIKAELGV